MSWQAGVYLGPVLYVVALQGGRRAIVIRLRDLGIVIATMIGALVTWCLLLSLTSSRFTARGLLDLLFSRPEPSFFPHGAAEWLKLLVSVPESLVHTGTGVLQEIGPAAQNVPALADNVAVLGAALLLVSTVLAAWATWLWLRERGEVRLARLQFLAVTLLSITCVTSLYRDLLQDKYKRYDYLPLVLAHLAGAIAGQFARDRPRRMRVAVVLVGLFALVEGVNDLRWVAAWHTRLNDRYYGVDHVSWMGYVRDLRHAHPDACTFVFAMSEVKGGQWNHETTAALASELPSYTVLSDAPVRWKKPLHTATIAEAKSSLRGCEWLSPEAQRLLR